MNSVVLMGRLVRDPDVRYAQSDQAMAVARYTLAVDRRVRAGQEKQADFISCIAFGKAGEFIEKYCKKGTKLVVRGHIQTGSYQKQDGTKVYTTDVVADEQEFAESKSSQNQTPAQGVAGAQGFMNIPDGIDEELPFN